MIMGKDNTGKYHPPKGKPSGAGKEEGLGIHPTDPEKLEQYMDITDKYTLDADELAPNVHLRHPNRNTEKGQNRFKNQQDRQPRITHEEQTFTEERTTVVAEELPGTLTKESFTELANFQSDHCISLFISTHSSGVEVNEHFDPVVFKNHLQAVAAKLGSKGLDQGKIERILKPGYDLLRNDAFWLKLSPGLAVFIAEGFFKYIRLPSVPKEDALIESSFSVTPLVSMLVSREYFYTLVISKKQVKLFRADGYGMEYIPVQGLPQGMEDAQADDKDDETTFRIGGLGGGGAASYHGHGGGNNVDDKAKLATYLETADDVIWKEVLHNETVPLLLAGVEYLIPIYKSVTDYKYVWDEALTGSHEHEDTITLYQQAKQKMEPYFAQRLNKALEVYGNKSATTLTTSSVEEIVPAAYYSRVSHLFVQKGAHRWGNFDEAANELKLHDDQQAESEDLIDNAVIKTILTGGEVYLLEKEQMPADTPVAAILRY